MRHIFHLKMFLFKSISLKKSNSNIFKDVEMHEDEDNENTLEEDGLPNHPQKVGWLVWGVSSGISTQN